MEDLLSEGAGVDSDDSVVFNRSIRFPSLAGLFIEVGARVMSGKERIKKKKCKREIYKQDQVSFKSFLYDVMTHLRNTVVSNAYLYMQLETGACFLLVVLLVLVCLRQKCRLPIPVLFAAD